MSTPSARLRRRSVSLLALLLLVSCSVRDVDKVRKEVKTAATAEQWRGWAEQVLDRYKTNSSPVPRSEWPEFVQRVAAPHRQWEVLVDRERRVHLRSLGGFESVGVVISSPDYEERAAEQQTTQRIYPGVYVRSTY